MEKKEAIEIIIEATKGNARKEDFFKLPNEIIGDVLDEYAKAINKNSAIPNVSDQRELLINYSKYLQNQWVSVNAEIAENMVDSFINSR